MGLPNGSDAACWLAPYIKEPQASCLVIESLLPELDRLAHYACMTKGWPCFAGTDMTGLQGPACMKLAQRQ